MNLTNVEPGVCVWCQLACLLLEIISTKKRGKYAACRSFQPLVVYCTCQRFAKNQASGHPHMFVYSACCNFSPFCDCFFKCQSLFGGSGCNSSTGQYAELNQWREVVPFVAQIYNGIEDCPSLIVHLW